MQQDKQKDKIISKEEFIKLPKGEAENKVLNIFRQNPDKAFKYTTICEIAKLRKSYVFCLLNNLRKLEMIEKRGEYFCLIQKENNEN